jgi:hypothetical protein
VNTSRLEETNEGIHLLLKGVIEHHLAYPLAKIATSGMSTRFGELLKDVRFFFYYSKIKEEYSLTSNWQPPLLGLHQDSNLSSAQSFAYKLLTVSTLGLDQNSHLCI